MRELIVELCRNFYDLGWCTGTGGGISICDGDTVFMAPSGVQKERIQPDDIFTVSRTGEVLSSPDTPGLKLTACAPLFLAAINQRGAQAVLHSHSVYAALVTSAFGAAFQISEVEMIKGLRGYGYHDTISVPIIENTAHECDLTDALSACIDANPQSDAVLVRNHGIYVWGNSWQQAKTQTECLDYLFRYALMQRQFGLSEPIATSTAL